MGKELLDTLLEEIQTGDQAAVDSRLANLTDEQLNELFEKVQPYKALGPASSEKLVLGSVCNLREKYLKKLITTAMVKFLFQMKDEFTVDEEMLESPLNKDDFMDTPPPNPLPEGFNIDLIYGEELTKMHNHRFPESSVISYNNMESDLSEDDLLTVNQRANARFAKLTKADPLFNAESYDAALKKAIDAQSDKERVIINRFLEKLFRYDPDVHQEKGEQSCVGDPERTDVSLLEGTNVVYDNIPSNDVHSMFNTYYEINYESLRDATQQIYNVKPDLEHAMIVYDVVDTQAEVDAFIHKYGSSSKNDIVTFPLNHWTFMGPFKENRKRIDFYNKHNTIIKALMEQQEKDHALGEELLKNRVKRKKIKAEKVFGKDSPEFETYRKLNPSDLDSKYGTVVEDVDEDTVKISREVIIDEETGKELKTDEEGCPYSALEIPITTINARTGETTQSRMFTRSADP